MTHRAEILTQIEALATEWDAGASDVAEHALATTFVRWPTFRGEGALLHFVAGGSYTRTNGTTLTEDVWFFLSLDGAQVATFKATAVATATSGVGAFWIEVEVLASAVNRQLARYVIVFQNPANGATAVQRFEGLIPLALDFSVDRVLVLSYAKQAATSSVVGPQAELATIQPRGGC